MRSLLRSCLEQVVFGGFCLAIALNRVTADELVVNTSFENTGGTFVADGNGGMLLEPGSTVIPGWTTTNGELVWLSNGNSFNPTTPYGSLFLDFTAYRDVVPYGGVTQMLNTTPGQAYQVSLSVGQFQNKAIYSGPVSVTAIAGAISSNSYTLTPVGGGGNQWVDFQTNFTAQGSSTIITFSGSSSHGGQYIGLDNISLTTQGGGAELIVNGGFENTGSTFVDNGQGAMSLAVGSVIIPGWTVADAETAWVSNSTPFGLRTPHGGMFLDLTGFHDSLPYGGVQQIISTTPGQNYTLSFSIGVDQDVGGYSGPATAVAAVSHGILCTTLAANGPWQSFGFGFVATAASTPLTIIGNSTAGGQYIGLDNVSVSSASSATPPLVITSINPANTNNLVLGFTSEIGHSYAVQSRGDLLTGNWLTLAGTTNSGNGTVVYATLTNAISRPRQFYRVQQVQ